MCYHVSDDLALSRACIGAALPHSAGATPEEGPMHIVHVLVHVKPDQVEAFKTAVLENARNSVLEPGVARFDIIQQADDATRFTMVEVYRTPADPAKHKETPHYGKWRAAVEPMMAEPRRSAVFRNVFPDDPDWG